MHCSLYRFPLSTYMDVLVFFIEFMCYRKFVCELFYEILSWYMFWVKVWVAHSIFVKEVSNLSTVSLDHCSIHCSIYFVCDYFPCFDASWPSLTFLSLLYSFISLYLIRFISFLIVLDVSLGFSIQTLLFLIRYVHSITITFRVGILRFTTHDVFYALHFMHERYADYIVGIFEPSFFSFLSPYYLSLRYVSCLKTTLRSWLHTLCLTAHTWAILEIGWRLFLGVYWMRSWDHGLHWSIPFLSVMDFRRWYDLYWGIPRSLMTFFFKMMPCTEA